MLRSIPFLLFILYSYTVKADTDKYRCTLRDNPSNSIVIAWNQINGNSAEVFYDVTDRGNNSLLYAQSRAVDRIVIAKGMNNHFCRLSGLQPNTVYYFIVKDNISTSPRFSFKTAPATANSRLSFIAGGDSRNNKTQRLNANKIVAKTRSNAVLFGGDMTNGDSDAEWREWFDDWQATIAADGRMTAIVAARGNHEWTNLSIYDLFDCPNSEIYYAITFGGNLFRTYTLNTNIAINGNQKIWLDTDFQSNNNVIWKAAQYHHPMRPHVSSKAENNNMVYEWAPLFEQYGLDFAVECDAHTVKTTYPIRSSTAPGSQEGFIRDDVNGVVYVGEGCWGAPLRANDDEKAWTRHSGSFNQVKWIFVDRNKIEIRTVKTDNADFVGYLNDYNRFSMPSFIDIWTPALYDDVLTIRKPGTERELKLVEPLNRQLYMQIQPIQIRAEMAEVHSINFNVHFYSDGNLIGIDSVAPYILSWTPPFAGNHKIRCTAFGPNQQMTHSNSAHIDVFTAPATLTTTSQITLGNDDAEQSSTGLMNINSSDLHMCFNQDTQTVGLRFRNINIPKGAVINSAHIQFQASSDNIQYSSLNIKIQDASNPAAFGLGTNNISSRLLLNQPIHWMPLPWLNGDAGGEQRTPGLNSLVQSIINREDWKTGGSLVFIINGTGNRTASSADANNGSSPVITINYTINPPAIIKPFVPDVSFCTGPGFSLTGSSGYSHYYWQNDLSNNQTNLYPVNSSGRYIMRVMDAYGQVSADTAIVTAFNSPQIDLGADLYLNGGSVSISAPLGYETYYWNTGEITETITTDETGIYTLFVVDSNGCTATDQVQVFSTIATMAIENIKNKLTFYPNPANRNLYLNIHLPADLYPFRIELIDYTGRNHFSNKYNQSHIDIDISHIVSGFYYLKMTDNQGHKISKGIIIN